MPFELGRPLGIPGDAAFQTRVLKDCLELLEAEQGPIIKDYPEQAPAVEADDDGAACPINFARPQQELSGSAAAEAALLEEVARLQPWYDRRVKAESRSTFGSSGLSIEAIATAVAQLFNETLPPSPIAELSLAEGLRLAVEDLKAFYTEAMMAQPGTSANDALVRWFWDETAAGRILLDARKICLESGDEALELYAQVFMVPRSKVDRMAG